MEDIVLIGGGGHCKSVIDSIRSKEELNIIGILDCIDNIGKNINGIKIIGTDDDAYEILKKGCKNAFITLGSIGNTSLRQALYSNLKNVGFGFPIIIDNSAIVSNQSKIKEGTFIGKGTIINSDVEIGENCIINTGVIIEHDCKIERFVHIAPGTTLSGNVKIGKNSHIGTNSTIIQGIEIGKNTLIGAGSVVVNDIFDNKKAYGNPCKEVL